MSLSDYLIGLVIFVAVSGSSVVTAVTLTRCWCPELKGIESAMAIALLFTCSLLTVHLVPAALGLLGRGSVLAAAAVLVSVSLASARMGDRAPAGDSITSAEQAEGNLIKASAALSVALVAVFLIAFAKNQAVATSGSIDFSTFHLPNVIAWIQTGSIWQVDNFVPSTALGNYPNNGDVMLLAFVLPWHNDFLVHESMWLFYVLAGLAVYAVVLRLGAARSLAAIAGCLVLAMPAVSIPALPNAMTDSVAVFALAVALLFLLRHDETKRSSDVVLAGISLGLCFGTKWYAVSTVAVVVAVWLVRWLFQRRELKHVVKDGGILVGLILAFGGVWLLRNWIISGSPLFPVKVQVAGFTLFDAPPDIVREAAGSTIADYIGKWDVWWNVDLPGSSTTADGIVKQWIDALAAPAFLVVGAVLAVLPSKFSRQKWRGPVGALLATAALLAVAYAVTPYTAGGPEGNPVLVGADSRYAVPALVAAVGIAAVGASEIRWVRVASALIAPLAVVHGLSRAGSGDLATARLSASDLAVGVLGLALLVAIVVGVRKLVAIRSWGTLGALGAAALTIAIGVGQILQDKFNDQRYVGGDPVIEEIAKEVDGGREVALTGLWSDAGTAPILPAFGPRFENQVSYVGVDADGLIERFSDEGAFIDAIETTAPDLVVVGLGRPGVPVIDEDNWLEEAGWRPVAGSDRFALYAPPV